MTRKITIGTLALMLVLAGVAFASGQKEPAQAPGSAQAPGTASAAPCVQGEKLVLTGSLTLAGQRHPVLKSGGKEYELMIPRNLTWNLDVKDGEQVSVEGYVVQGMGRRAQENDDDIDLLVTKATVKGKEYDLSQYRGQTMGMGRMRGGRGGNRGWGPGRDTMGPGRGYNQQS